MSVLADLDGEIGVNQLAEQVNLAPSTVHRLLKLLCDEGIAEWNPTTRGYSAGPGLYRIGARVVANMQLPQIVTPFVQRLAERYNETILFGLYLPTQRAMSFAARADGSQALQYRIEMNTPLPLLWGASGKVILAELPDDEIARIHAEGEASPAAGQDVPDLASLMTELHTIHAAGVAVTDSEKLPGARGVAAPVHGAHGVIGCLVLTSPGARLPHGRIDEIAASIVATADELSHTLGPGAPEKASP
jgi:DNA-binding IclR family transcriptional regulator